MKARAVDDYEFEVVKTVDYVKVLYEEDKKRDLLTYVLLMSTQSTMITPNIFL